MFDCLLLTQHCFCPPKPHFLELLSHIALSQSLSMKGMQVDGRWKWGEVIIFGSYGMSHGWNEVIETFQVTGGTHKAIQTQMFSVSLCRIFWEFQQFPHETFENYSVWVFKGGLQWPFLQSSAAAFVTFSHAALSHIPAFPYFYITPFIPIRHGMVLFSCVKLNWHTIPLPDLWPPQDTGSTL